MHINRISRLLLDTLFPRGCKVCEGYISYAYEGTVCEECLDKIQIIAHPYCVICSIPFISEKVPEGYICGKCREGGYQFDKAVSFAIYDDLLKKIIHQYKYNKRIEIVDSLLSFIYNACCDRFSSSFNKADIVMHVPLYISNLRERGFDQSFILADRLSSMLGTAFIYDNLTKDKYTINQAGLDKKKRGENIKGVFSLRKPADIKGKDIILVDDILTTGATANECARVLKRAGAKRVTVMTIGRAI